LVVSSTRFFPFAGNAPGFITAADEPGQMDSFPAPSSPVTQSARRAARRSGTAFPICRAIHLGSAEPELVGERLDSGGLPVGDGPMFNKIKLTHTKENSNSVDALQILDPLLDGKNEGRR